eukprot:156104-Pyramimonas_sp.AAC.1
MQQQRPVQHHELTGADADAKVSGMLTDITIARPRADQRAWATTERDYQEAALRSPARANWNPAAISPTPRHAAHGASPGAPSTCRPT